MTESTGGSGTVLFGGSGFLGSHILSLYPDIISVGRTPPLTRNRHVPISDLHDLSALRGVSFDRVIYIIGNTDHAVLERQVLPPGEPTAFDYHVGPLIRTLEQLKDRTLLKFVHFSSILLYDDRRMTLPVTEDAPIAPYRSRYIMSKYLAEEVCKFYGRWVPIVNVRLANLYGPTPLRRRDLVHILVRQLLDEGAASVWSRAPQRDFIYVDDAAHAVVKLLASDFAGTLNLGTGEMTSVGTIVDTLQDASGCPITELGRPVEGPMQFRCDTALLRRAIAWNPQMSAVDGTRRTYKMMRAYRDRGELQ